MELVMVHWMVNKKVHLLENMKERKMAHLWAVLMEQLMEVAKVLQMDHWKGNKKEPSWEKNLGMLMESTLEHYLGILWVLQRAESLGQLLVGN